MIRAIVQHPDPRLRARCEAVGAVTPAVRRLAEDLVETMYDAPGRGLAAPQVGVLWRLVAVDAGWREGPRAPLVLVDPEIVAVSDETAVGVEGCLSIPNQPMRVARATGVRVRWTDLDGAPRERAFEGAWAVCLQHELDHLDGRLILDHGAPIEPAPPRSAAVAPSIAPPDAKPPDAKPPDAKPPDAKPPDAPPPTAPSPDAAPPANAPPADAASD